MPRKIVPKTPTNKHNNFSRQSDDQYPIGSAKTFQNSLGGRKPNLMEIEQLAQLRQYDVEALLKNNAISLEQIHGLDWGGKFEVANKYLDICDDAAKHALLHDPHHAVRAAASLFKPKVKNLAGTYAAVAELARTLANGQRSIQTLAGEKSLAQIEEMILSTHPLAVLVEAEIFISSFEDDNGQEGSDTLLAILPAAIKAIP